MEHDGEGRRNAVSERKSRIGGRSKDKVSEHSPSSEFLWTMYNTKAQDEDVTFSKRLKATMDGLIIFSALFSAIVTAFIIEDYPAFNLKSQWLSRRPTFYAKRNSSQCLFHSFLIGGPL